MSLSAEPRPRVLVAGVGNVFLGDDGFGVEVARRLAGETLAGETLPGWVRVGDFGIRGVHLAYELLEGYEAAILVDASPRGEAPGTVYVIEPDLDGEPDPAVEDGTGGLVDAHGMEPDAVFALLKALGGDIPKLLVVGCEPAEVSERMGLSPPVAGAVDQAMAVVRELIGEHESGKGG
ncbi:MAG TPA: hydrogenase maturation protease [Actinomycetota bacterium]|nr:hydrogenase maturation protease [Actinomycetota bacterium]